MWHASARSYSELYAKQLVTNALADVGDKAAGQWIEINPGHVGTQHYVTVHLRRRLTPAEAALVGPLRDIRGTEEEMYRLADLLAAAPLAMRRMLEAVGMGRPATGPRPSGAPARIDPDV